MNFESAYDCVQNVYYSAVDFDQYFQNSFALETIYCVALSWAKRFYNSNYKKR